jgi:DNA-binding transcriptional regulator YdaS (Cro superfamily)
MTLKTTAQERKAIADAVGINPQYLYQALTGRRSPVAELCIKIEKASKGKIKRHELRPDWAAIWPEYKPKK